MNAGDVGCYAVVLIAAVAVGLYWWAIVAMGGVA